MVAENVQTWLRRIRDGRQGRGRGDTPVFGIAVIVLVALLGVALLPGPLWPGLTLGLSSAVRTELAGGLMTGAVIGLALLAYEHDRDRRQEHRRVRLIDRSIAAALETAAEYELNDFGLPLSLSSFLDRLADKENHRSAPPEFLEPANRLLPLLPRTGGDLGPSLFACHLRVRTMYVFWFLWDRQRHPRDSYFHGRLEGMRGKLERFATSALRDLDRATRMAVEYDLSTRAANISHIEAGLRRIVHERFLDNANVKLWPVYSDIDHGVQYSARARSFRAAAAAFESFERVDTKLVGYAADGGIGGFVLIGEIFDQLATALEPLALAADPFTDPRELGDAPPQPWIVEFERLPSRIALIESRLGF